jgi:hypothetical protein
MPFAVTRKERVILGILLALVALGLLGLVVL